MTPYYQDDWLTVYHGDCKTVMAEMEPESVHCVVTSPPYWGLRDYGDSGQLGLEPTPEQYVANMVAVFREVRRVLRADGTVWLNLGDSYASSPPGNVAVGVSGASTLHGVNGASGQYRDTLSHSVQTKRNTVVAGLKPKDLVGIPWRVAFALQADGWYLRSDIIWSKPNPMPESVTDRPTKSHEYIFLLSKSARYYFDADAVREPALQPSGEAVASGQHKVHDPRGNGASHLTTLGTNQGSAGRNIRSVWTIATAPYPGAHFATFPPKLVEPCIKAGTSEKGVCPECGAPWERVVERGSLQPVVAPSDLDRYGTGEAGVHRKVGGQYQKWLDANPSQTTGWRPTCSHVTSIAARLERIGADQEAIDHARRNSDPYPPEPIPAVVLDPFAGSGTTGMVAQSLSRRAVLIDLSLDYLGQLMDRNAEIPLGLGA